MPASVHKSESGGPRRKLIRITDAAHRQAMDLKWIHRNQTVGEAVEIAIQEQHRRASKEAKPCPDATDRRPRRRQAATT